jgi:hypothetical protein
MPTGCIQHIVMATGNITHTTPSLDKNRNSWWSLAQETPETAVCFCSLRNHTRLVLYLSYATKTTEKQLLILEFHTPSSPWRRADVATTSRRPVQQYTWRHWDSAMTLTQQRKSVYHICCIWYFYTTPDTTARSPDSTRQIIFLRNISRWW